MLSQLAADCSLFDMTPSSFNNEFYGDNEFQSAQMDCYELNQTLPNSSVKTVVSKRIRKIKQKPVMNIEPKIDEDLSMLRHCSFREINNECQEFVNYYDQDNLFGDITLSTLLSQNEENAQKKAFLSSNKKIKSVHHHKQPQASNIHHKFSISTIGSLEEYSGEQHQIQYHSSKSLEEGLEAGKQVPVVNNTAFLSIEFEQIGCPNIGFQEIAQEISMSEPMLAERLRIAQEPVNWMIGHLSEVHSQIHSKQLLEIFEERRLAFEATANKILVEESMKSEGNSFFFVKTYHNYITGLVENKEIGYSKEFMNTLKMTKNTQELINQSLRSKIQETFSAPFQKELAQYFLNNLTLPTFGGYETQVIEPKRVHAFESAGEVKSFDGINIPVKLSVERVSIPYSHSQLIIPFVDDYLTIISVSFSSEVSKQIISLRSKLSKRQSFRYRMLFPTMQKRKQKIDKFTKNQRSQSNQAHHQFVQQFLEKFYPSEFSDYKSELAHIKSDLEANRSQNGTQHQSLENLNL